MMTQKERAAMQQALEALEVYGEHAKDCPQYPTYTRPQDYPKCDCGFEEAITALREALDRSGEANEMVVGWDRVKPEAIASDPLYQQGFVDGVEEGRNQVAEQAELNLNCKSVQARLATSRWYVRAEQAEQIPQKERKDFIDGYDAGMADAKRMQQAEQSQLADATLEPVAWMDLHKELGKLRWMGGDEGWDNAINAVRDRLVELASPVRTKDLTDAHILVLWQETATPDAHRIERFARAVIAADREKNK